MSTNKKKMDIIATVGPASDDRESIKALCEAGVTTFRLNFSHGTADGHNEVANIIREVSGELNLPIQILADLQGPKIRIGKFENDSIDLHRDMVIRMDSDSAPGDETRVNLPHANVIEALEVGSRILLDDGNVFMEIVGKGDNYVDAKVLSGKKLSNGKGINIPNVYFPIPALTDKDRADLQTALEIGVDVIALSFVQKPTDVLEAKALIEGRAKLYSKIEKPSALKYLDEIMVESDGLMVARGDLGVEIPAEYVPGVQREIVTKARDAGKYVIVATHMLDSMIESVRPTRAEANDVSTAVKQGADAVMLSGETAVGMDPVNAVQYMDRISRATLLEMRNPNAFLRMAFYSSTKEDASKAEKRTENDSASAKPEVQSADEIKPAI